MDLIFMHHHEFCRIICNVAKIYPSIIRFLKTGCSGVDACKMIKDDMIPYPNKDGKNIECFLSYKKNSPKLKQIEQDLIDNDEAPESVVKIYAMWNTKKVDEAPLMHGPQAEI